MREMERVLRRALGVGAVTGPGEGAGVDVPDEEPGREVLRVVGMVSRDRVDSA